MENHNQQPHQNNSFNVFVGLLVGSVAGAVTMLLLAPQSGEETRKKIQEKGMELRDRTFEAVEGTMSQVRAKTNELTSSGREKFDELKASGREKLNDLKQQGQELVVEKLDRVSEAAEAGKKAIQKP